MQASIEDYLNGMPLVKKYLKALNSIFYRVDQQDCKALLEDDIKREQTSIKFNLISSFVILKNVKELIEILPAF